MIEIGDIEKLAKLSRIKLSEAEKESLRKEMDSILGYVAEIQSVSIKALDFEKPDHRNVFRNDSEPHESGVYTEKLLGEAPRRDRKYLKVKKIL